MQDKCQCVILQKSIFRKRKDIESAKGPGIKQAPLRVLCNDLVGRTLFEDAAGQCAQTLGGLWVLGSSAIVDNADFGALFLGVPRALGQLQMSHDGAIGSLLMRFTQVHVRKNSRLCISMSRKISIFMYL